MVAQELVQARRLGYRYGGLGLDSACLISILTVLVVRPWHSILWSAGAGRRKGGADFD